MENNRKIRYFGTTGKPHPNMVELSTLMKEEAENMESGIIFIINYAYIRRTTIQRST